MKLITAAGLLLLISQGARGEVFESLSGIPPEMSIYVRPWGEGCPSSLSAAELVRDVEKGLRQARIEVVGKNPFTLSLAVTCLEVEEIDARAVSVSLQFWQPVRGKINDWNGSAPTWSAEELLHAFGTERDTQGRSIHATVGELVKGFLNDFREANSE